MDEKTEQLIRELADKLGTTAEHLWGILVKQAFISGITDLLILTTFTIFTIWSFFLVRKKTTRTNKDDWTSREWRNEGAVLAWVFWGIMMFVNCCFVCGKASIVVGAVLNPEYWALKQILP